MKNIVNSESKNSISNKLSLVNCATASNGEIGFCNCNTCSENEGDCDAHDECASQSPSFSKQVLQ